MLTGMGMKKREEMKSILTKFEKEDSLRAQTVL